MEEPANTTTGQPTEEYSGRHYKEPMHSDKVLAVCAWIIIIGGAIGSYNAFNGIEVIVSTFLCFTSGVFLYTVARIYTTLREIRDNK